MQISLHSPHHSNTSQEFSFSEISHAQVYPSLIYTKTGYSNWTAKKLSETQFISKNSLQVHVKQGWKSWAASVFQSLGSEGTQTAVRFQGTLMLLPQRAGLSPASSKTFPSPLEFRKKEDKNLNNTHFCNLCNRSEKGAQLGIWEEIKQSNIWDNRNSFHAITQPIYSRQTNILTLPPKRIWSRSEKLVTYDTQVLIGNGSAWQPQEKLHTSL